MSCTYIFSRNERLYVQLESAWGTVPNASGVASVAGSNYCRHISFAPDPSIAIYTRADKTGTRSQPQGTAGMETAQWKAPMSLAGNGAAGVKPDMDPFLQALFGRAPTIVSSTSVTYSLSDLIPSLSIWSFRTDSAGTSNPNQRVAAGSIVQTAQFQMGVGQNIATVDLTGLSKVVLGSFDFTARGSAGDTEGQCGLSAFPDEPGSPVGNGNAAEGFYGSLTIDSQVLTTIRTGTIKMDTGNILSDVFGSKYKGCPIGGLRNFTFECELYDGSDTATKDLYSRAYDKAPITATMVIGNQVGNTWTYTLNGLQLAPYTYDDSQEAYTLKFSPARATSNAGLTEMTLAIT
jgi:hypothetical protein